MSNICDTTDLMVHGHVPWLELPGSHVHAGGHAEVRLFWGRDMQPDGLMRRPGLAAYALSPSGTKQDIDVFEQGPELLQPVFQRSGGGLIPSCCQTLRQLHHRQGRKLYFRHPQGTARCHTWCLLYSIRPGFRAGGALHVRQTAAGWIAFGVSAGLLETMADG